MDTGSFPGVKRPGRGVDHPPPSSVVVKERVEMYLYSWASVARSRVNFTLPLRISRGVIRFVIVKSLIAAKYTSQVTVEFRPMVSALNAVPDRCALSDHYACYSVSSQ
jgi:hypothetical protein